MEDKNDMNEAVEKIGKGFSKLARDMAEMFKAHNEAVERTKAKLQEIARRIREKKGGDDSAASR